MNKQFIFFKRFKKELIDELVQDNVQENFLSETFEELVYENVRETIMVIKNMFQRMKKRSTK